MSALTNDVRAPDRRVAATLSIVPGLGQLYNRQPAKAGFFGLWTLVTMGAAVLLITQGERIGHDLLVSRAGGLFLLVALVSVLAFLALFLTGIYLWASAGVDAWRSADAIGSGSGADASRRWFFRL